MGLTKHEQQIMHDYDQAFTHAQKYIVRFLVQVNARGLMIESAARKFAAFLELPASSSRVLAILDFAWGVVTVAVPVLRLVAVVRAAEVAKQLTEASAAAGTILIQNTSPGRITRVVDTVNKGKDAVEQGVGVYDKGQKAVEAIPDGMEAIGKLDVSKGPIKELVEDARKIVTMWSQTLDFLVEQKAARLARPDHPYKETLLAYSQKRLPLPQMFSGDELDQLELEHLWNMIAHHVREKVELRHGTMDGWHVRGLNDTQENTITELFGPRAKRGPYFTRMTSPYIEVTLINMGGPIFTPKLGTNTSWKTGPGHMKP